MDQKTRPRTEYKNKILQFVSAAPGHQLARCMEPDSDHPPQAYFESVIAWVQVECSWPGGSAFIMEPVTLGYVGYPPDGTTAIRFPDGHLEDIHGSYETVEEWVASIYPQEAG